MDKIRPPVHPICLLWIWEWIKFVPPYTLLFVVDMGMDKIRPPVYPLVCCGYGNG